MQRTFSHTFNAKVGDNVEFSLPENATTGFLWHINADKALDTLETKEDLPEPGVIGGGYTRKFNVSSKKAGTFKMHAELKQAWDQHEHPAEIHTFEFNFAD